MPNSSNLLLPHTVPKHRKESVANYTLDHLSSLDIDAEVAFERLTGIICTIGKCVTKKSMIEKEDRSGKEGKKSPTHLYYKSIQSIMSYALFIDWAWRVLLFDFLDFCSSLCNCLIS